MNNKLKKLLILAAWLVIWEVAAMLIHNSILLAGPSEVAKTLIGLLQTVDFYRICLTSLGRIMAGMFSAFLLGCVCGGLMYHCPFLDEFLSPALAVMKSIPVASFVVLLLIWKGAASLSIWISFLVIFPNICVSMKNGLRAVGGEYLEMAGIFHIKGLSRWLYIYRPAVVPYLISCMEISIGMSFKSGVAAEVIGTPDYSIGERIYISKVYLDTAGLFAWTFALIVMSFLVEKALLRLFRKLLLPAPGMEKRGDASGWQEFREEDRTASCGPVELCGLKMSYDGRVVLQNVSKRLERGRRYFLMAPSGGGKTTLLMLMAGLQQPDEGCIKGISAVSVQFQEDRLLNGERTITNIAPYDRKRKKYYKPAMEILPKDCLMQCASELSGGMKRRVALLRAMLYRYKDPDAVCLLDEPFAGLDEETKKRVMAFIKKYQNGRTLVIATHDETDCERMDGILWRLDTEHPGGCGKTEETGHPGSRREAEEAEHPGSRREAEEMEHPGSRREAEEAEHPGNRREAEGMELPGGCGKDGGTDHGTGQS